MLVTMFIQSTIGGWGNTKRFTQTKLVFNICYMLFMGLGRRFWLAHVHPSICKIYWPPASHIFVARGSKMNLASSSLLLEFLSQWSPSQTLDSLDRQCRHLFRRMDLCQMTAGLDYQCTATVASVESTDCPPSNDKTNGHQDCCPRAYWARPLKCLVESMGFVIALPLSKSHQR